MADKAQHGAYFINSGGQTVHVPVEDVSKAAQLGWVPASQSQVDDYKLQTKYGGTGEQLKTFGEGAAQALTLGASTWAEKALGVNPEDIKGREQANPIAHGAGTVAGIAAPLVLTGGAAGAAEGVAEGAAELSAPSLVAKAGQLVKGGVEAALPEASSTAGRIATQAVASGAGSAVEGAAYGLGNVVHESALGDPNITAQSALATIGMSGLLGGAIGAGGGLLSGLAKEATGGEIGAKLHDWLGDFESERNLKAAGAIKSDITRARNQLGEENLKKLGTEMRDLGLVSSFSTPASTLEKATAMLDDNGPKLTDALKGADAISPDAAPSIGEVIGRAKKEILDPLAGNPLEQSAANQVAKNLEGYTEKYAVPGSFGKGTLSLEKLHEIRQEVSDKIYGFKGNLTIDNTYKEALYDFRKILSDEIEKGLDRAGGTEAVQQWKDLNRIYTVASKARDFAQAGVDRAQGNNLIPLTGILGGIAGAAAHGIPGGTLATAGTMAARRFGSGLMGTAARGLKNFLEKGAAETVADGTAEAIAAERAAGVDMLAGEASSAPETVAALSQLERAKQAVADRIDTMASTLVRGSQKAAYVGRNEIAAGVGKSFGKSLEDSSAEFSRRTAKLNTLANDPKQMMARLEQHVSDLHEHAPQTSQAAQIASARAVNFLASKVPQAPQRGPLAPKWQPSAADVAKFNRYWEAANDPTVVLKQAAAGTLTPEAVETLQACYPDLLNQMRQSIVSQISSHPDKVPYRTKQMISMLMGQDMDGSLSLAAGNQQAFAMSLAKGKGTPGHGRSPLGGLKGLTLNERMLTPMQASSRRR